MTTNANFLGLGIAPQIMTILDQHGYRQPTPIQSRAIPIAVTGKDIIGIAQTGTGKTLAFGIPLIQRLLGTPNRGLVVVPTRELALQVDEALRRISRGLPIRTAVIIGGASMNLQMRDLRNQPNIIIGTPGRIIDHLERRSLDLHHTTILVLDEADRMLDLGFAPQIRRILQVVPKARQTMLFSATMPADIVRIAEQYMELPLRIEIAPAGTAAEGVTQELFIVSKDQKPTLLGHLLTEYQGTVLVFTRTKHGATKLTRIVRGMGHQAIEIHGNRSLAQRKEALRGFKEGRYRILVATDIAARGIDVKGITLVVNYDLPEQAEDYVHRIGRTARAGQPGQAISFVQPDQRQKIRAIERLIRLSLSIKPLPALPQPQTNPSTPQTRVPAPVQPQPRVHPTWGRRISPQPSRYWRGNRHRP